MAASSSAGANPNKKSFDVFINHRGDDTKETFAMCLYRNLVSKGLTAFVDNEEMQPGFGISSQIKDAVRTASVHVAVFSPRYAESAWCLDELQLMVESTAPIIPVFYHVAPGEFRSKYAEAFETHENKQRHDSNTIKKWKATLEEVASKEGFELKPCNQAPSGTISEEELELMLDLVDEVVAYVLRLVKKPMSELHVAEHPTGLVEKVEDFEKKVLLPQQQSRKPPIFGIVGLGGVGKSTLVKELFNMKKSNHDKSCFLFNVKDNAANLESLQTQLLKSLTGLDQQVDNVDERKGILKSLLKSRNALVVLDDVDDMEQVKELLPVQTCELCSDSLILITSRKRDVLRRSGIDELSIYRLTELEYEYSKKLFCSHAFNKTSPSQGFAELVDIFIESCYGFPLFLNEFGKLVCGKGKSVWEAELRSLPNKIKEKLRKISYDTLSAEEQEIFIDVACVFKGENREEAISTWNGSRWKGSQGLQNLQDKSIVEVDSKNLIQMSDHLRDLGRALAESSSQRRLWYRGTKDVIEKLLQQPSEVTVRAILVDSEYHGPLDRNNEFDLNYSQKVICERILTSVQILGDRGYFLHPILSRVEMPNLIWLFWECHDYSFSALPSWVPITNLRVLRVCSISLCTLWEREVESQAPLQYAECLEEFRADNCSDLNNIRELERSKQLRQLRVSGCGMLEELPNMKSLVSLEVLWAERCEELKDIKGLEHTTKLRNLIVSECSKLEKLSGMEGLVSLEELRADECVKLKSITGLENAKKLRRLIVNGCSNLERLSGTEGLVSLEELQADTCVKLKSISGLENAKKLRRLIVSNCSNLERLSGTEGLVSLEVLEADRCVKLKSISGLAQCTKLRKLSVFGCSQLEELKGVDRNTCEVFGRRG